MFNSLTFAHQVEHHKNSLCESGLFVFIRVAEFRKIQLLVLQRITISHFYVTSVSVEDWVLVWF